MGKDNQIIDVIEYQEVIPDDSKIYDIDTIANMLKVSSTLINTIIFKLNKRKKSFIKDANKLTQSEFEIIELAVSLQEEGKSIDEIATYFIENKNGLIDKETMEVKKDLTKMDSQIIAKNISLEVKRQTDRIIEEMKGDFAKNVFEQFEKQASKIAKISLAAMEETKNVLVDEIAVTKDEIVKLKEENEKARLENQSLRLENEELLTREINKLKAKVNRQEEELKNKEEELKEQKQKSIWKRMFNK